MGNRDNYIGPWAPKEDLAWQNNVPAPKKKYNVEKVKKMIAATSLSVSDLIVIAWDSARTYRRTDKRGGANGIAILLPLTFTMPPTSAIIMLSCIYWGALFGGAITSILFNIPGEPWSVATTFDGYPMAQEGKAGEALTGAFTSSFIGAFFAVVMITFLAPLVAKFALQFGPPEFFAVYLLTFCSFVGMNKGSPFKVISAMMLGFALAAVGMDTVTGQLRMTFGSTELMRGFDFLIAVIGLFGIGEILQSMEEGLSFSGKSAKIRAKVVFETWAKLPKYWATSLRSCLIGCFEKFFNRPPMVWRQVWQEAE